jgi:hypothetical protein
VAASDARLDYSAVDEDRLIRERPPYLRLRARLAHWDVYEVVGAPGLVRGPARLAALGPESFALAFERPGPALVRIRYTPYWRVEAGRACVGEEDGWTLVRADRPGLVRISTRFSADSAWRAAAGRPRRCAVG